MSKNQLKLNKAKPMNPFIKDAEKMPCTYCKLTKKANNNISSIIDDKNNKVKKNENNISQKKMFGTPDDLKKVKKPTKKTLAKKNFKK